MAQCKTCSGEVGAMDFGNIKFALVAAAVAGAIITDKGNQMLTKNADGSPKTTGYLVENPKVKDGLYLAGGALATMLSDGNEWITGLGVGVAVYGGFNLVKSMMTPATNAGIGYIPPQQIAGYIPPNNIAQQPPSPIQQQQFEQLMSQIQDLKIRTEQQQKMPIGTMPINIKAGM